MCARANRRFRICGVQTKVRCELPRLGRVHLQSGEAVGAVLLYRVITFKILVTLIWAVRQYLRDRAGGLEPAVRAAYCSSAVTMPSSSRSTRSARSTRAAS